jgi:periplasmic protein TonB
MIVRRYASALLLAFVITVGLFYLMQWLILIQEGKVEEAFRGKVIDFVRLKRESETQTKKREMPEKHQIEEAPAPPPMNLAQSDAPPASGALAVESLASDLKVDMTGPSLGTGTDSEAVPIVRVQPVYPPRAQQRGIEGWVLLEFTITEAGTVRSARVVDAEPSGIFDRSALKAIRKFKYKPKIVDGVAQEQSAQRFLLTFELED